VQAGQDDIALWLVLLSSVMAIAVLLLSNRLLTRRP